MAKKSSPIPKKADTTLPLLAHLLGLITGFLGPLIILLATEDKRAKTHAKKALNWQFSLLIYYAVSFVLMFVLIGFLTFFAVAILNIIFCIMAAVKASKEELWDYPLAIPFF